MKTSILIIFAVGIVLMFCPHAFPQATPCPPGVRPNGKTTQNKSTSTQAPPNKNAPGKNAPTQHQAGRGGHQGHSHGGGGLGVGIGATVDLSGVGERRAEPDPFAVPAERQPVGAHTEERPKTPKKSREMAKPDPFANVQLTGEQAKEQN